MSADFTAHQLFRMHIMNVKMDLFNEAVDQAQSIGTRSQEWQTFSGRYKQWVNQLHSYASRPAVAPDIYTRPNYVMLAAMIYDLQVHLPHLAHLVPQWSYLVTELHCRVLEREALAAAHPEDQDVKARLQGLLCRMQQ